MFKPLGDRVLLSQLAANEKSAGGLYLPETVQEKTQFGIVEAIGNDKDIILKVGQKVIFNKFLGMPLKYEGRDYILIRQAEIFGVEE